jgi:hypothetical protein
MRRAAALVLLLLLPGCSGSTDEGVAGSASCAAVIEYDGHTYWGHGELTRVPETTGRTETGVRPGCNDHGSDGEMAEEPDEQVTIEELADLPLREGFLANGSFYKREPGELPAVAAAWFEPVSCAADAPLVLTGRWIGVTSKHEPRFDGDLRAPYRLEVWVSDGPETYVDSRIFVRADAHTDPQLGPEDVKGSLWAGGNVTAEVHCEEGLFVADGLTTP